MTENKPDHGYSDQDVDTIMNLVRNDCDLQLPEDVDDWPLIEPSRECLAEYLVHEQCGKHFSINEIVSPHHKGIAKRCDFTEFIPPLHLWPLVGIVLMLGDIMRDVVGRSVNLRNLWRPVPYNMIVARRTRASSLKGDHSNACAGDFDFQDITDRRKAEGAMRAFSILHPELKISLGMGGRSLHVGALSPRGHRHWYYNSYRNERRIKVK